MIKPSPATAQSVRALRAVKWLSRHKQAANYAAHLFHGPLDRSPLFLTPISPPKNAMQKNQPTSGNVK
jgi:hypothetical protein